MQVTSSAANYAGVGQGGIGPQHALDDDRLIESALVECIQCKPAGGTFERRPQRGVERTVDGVMPSSIPAAATAIASATICSRGQPVRYDTTANDPRRRREKREMRRRRGRSAATPGGRDRRRGR